MMNVKFLILGLLFYSLSFSQNVPSYVPTDSLVGWWAFSGNAGDSSGNGNHGTISGASLTTDRNNKSNSAYFFNGSSAYIDLDSIDNLTMSNFSYFGWIKSNGGSDNLTILNTKNGRVWLPKINNTDLFSANFVNNNGTNPVLECSKKGIVDTTSWHSFGVTVSGIMMKLFFDGVLVDSTSSSQGYNDTYLNSEIGSNGRSNNFRYNFFHGMIDDIGIWDRTLSKCEIEGLHSTNILLKFTAHPKDTTLLINDTAEFIVQVSDPSATYQWQYNDTSTIGWYDLVACTNCSGMTSDTFSTWQFNSVGTHQFRCRVNINNCSVTSEVATMTRVDFVGINESEIESVILIFPNPASSILHLQMKRKSSYSIQLINLQGQIIKETSSHNSIDWDIRDIENGMYLVRICHGGDCMQERIVKME